MKVINQIIRYLYSNRSLTDRQMDFLQSKGFYGCDRSKYGDYDYEWDDSYDFYYYEEEEDEDDWESQTNRFGIKQRRGNQKRTKKKVIQSAQKRTRDNFQLTHLPSHITSHIWWLVSLKIELDPEILQQEIEELFSKDRELYFKFLYTFPFTNGKFYVHEYWEWFFMTFGQKNLEKWVDDIQSIFNRLSVESEKRKTLRPTAYFRLREQENTVNDLGWALRLKINADTWLALTNYYGEEALRKINH